jgi:hypothetical protein
MWSLPDFQKLNVLAQTTRVRSYQVVLRMPNPPKLIRAAVNFPSREEAVM